MVEWIEPELIRVFCPVFADVFVGREPTEGFQSLGEVISREESGEVPAKLIVAVVVIAANGSFFQRAVHPLDLTIRPGMFRLCEPMIDIVGGAGPFEGVRPDALASGQTFFDLAAEQTLPGVVK